MCFSSVAVGWTFICAHAHVVAGALPSLEELVWWAYTAYVGRRLGEVT